MNNFRRRKAIEPGRGGVAISADVFGRIQPEEFVQIQFCPIGLQGFPSQFFLDGLLRADLSFLAFHLQLVAGFWRQLGLVFDLVFDLYP